MKSSVASATPSSRNTSARHVHFPRTQPTIFRITPTNGLSCSLQCFKTHKSTHPEPTTVTAAPSAPILPEVPLPAPLPRYLKNRIDFSALATNPRFQDLVKTHPTLLPTLQRVYAATIEPDPEAEARRRRWAGRGGFRGRGSRGRGRGRGGRFGGFDEHEGRWTPKQGDAKAMKQLKELRQGDRGDEERNAMAEFVSLVEDIFAKKDKTADDG
jgi:hypothetical protein